MRLSLPLERTAMSTQRRARLIADLALAPLELSAAERQQLREDATVNVVCAPEDRDRVLEWVDQLEHRDWFRVRCSVFLAPGRALFWQTDGVLAPRTPSLLNVRLPRLG